MESKSFEKDNLREALHDVVDEMDKEKVRELLHESTNRGLFKIETKSMT